MADENENEMWGHLLAIEVMLNLLVTRVCLEANQPKELADAFRNSMRKNLDAITLPDDPAAAIGVKQALIGADKAIRRMLSDDSRKLLHLGEG